MKHTSLLILMMVMTLILSACATTTWKKVEPANITYTGDRFTIKLPQGWMFMQEEDTLLISKDGPDLQRILIASVSLDEAVPKEEETVSEMLPSELADKFIAELKSSQEFELPSLTILSNEPISIAGNTGYSLHLTYKTDKGLRIEMLSAGFVNNKYFYTLSYSAPTLHFFNKDRSTFETVVSSFQLK